MVECLLALALAAAAAQAAPETLRYAVKGPGGATVGEAQMMAAQSGDRWSFAFSLDASVPGFTVSDSYQSLAGGDFCSVDFVKQFTHGARKGAEKTTFDSRSGTATRETLGGGGKSQFSAPPCARDALGFLAWMRRELAQGRRPAAATMYFGAPYQLSFEYAADQVTVSVKGPVARSTFQVWFLPDAASTPARVAVPLPAGTFSLELLR
jgi:hypothetical protein